MTSQGGPRIPPLPRERWDDEARAAMTSGLPDSVARRFFGTGDDAMQVPNALCTFANHPALATPFLAFNNILMSSRVLERRPRELMVLRVAWRSSSMYEWAQHVKLAPRFAITPEEIEAIAQGADSNVWTPLEKDLLQATDELIDRYRISDETWARLADHLDARQLMEVVFTVGTYTTLAMAFNSFGLELDPGLEAPTAPPEPEQSRKVTR